MPWVGVGGSPAASLASLEMVLGPPGYIVLLTLVGESMSQRHGLCRKEMRRISGCDG